MICVADGIVVPLGETGMGVPVGLGFGVGFGLGVAEGPGTDDADEFAWLAGAPELLSLPQF
jgi:hypothetical protein